MTGKLVSSVWRGAGTSIFIELGELTKQSNKNNSSGEDTIAIEWSWRVEEDNTILLGSFNEDVEINYIVNLLRGALIKRISFFSKLKEIEVEFDKNLRLLSFATADGDPEWSVRNKDRWLYYRKGKFISEENT